MNENEIIYKNQIENLRKELKNSQYDQVNELEIKNFNKLFYNRITKLFMKMKKIKTFNYRKNSKK